MELPLDEDVRPRILAGKRVSARQYLDALAAKGCIKAQFAAALDAFDVLATPTVGTPAIPLDHVDQTSTPARLYRARESPRALRADGAQWVDRGRPAEWSTNSSGGPTMVQFSPGLAGPMGRQRIGATACHRDCSVRLEEHDRHCRPAAPRARRWLRL